MNWLRDSRASRAVRWLVNFHGQRREISRRALFDALGRVTPIVSVRTEGLHLLLSTADRTICRETFALGVYERDLLEDVRRELIRLDAWNLEGRDFVDVGANLGSATCMALGHYGAVRSWAFEPAPMNAQLLRHNVIANGFGDRAVIMECAVSDEDGATAFEISKMAWADHRVPATDLSHPSLVGDEHDRLQISVTTRTLDSVCAVNGLDVSRVGLVVIDVQGYEGQVLSGATQLLRAGVPIVCEYWPYGLRRANGLTLLHDVIARERSTFIDLGLRSAGPQPTTAVQFVANRLEGVEYTDLLLLPERPC